MIFYGSPYVKIGEDLEKTYFYINEYVNYLQIMTDSDYISMESHNRVSSHTD